MNEQKAEQQKRTKRQEQRNMQQKSNYRKIKHANWKKTETTTQSAEAIH